MSCGPNSTPNALTASEKLVTTPAAPRRRLAARTANDRPITAAEIGSAIRSTVASLALSICMPFFHTKMPSAGPVNGFTLWKPEALKITKGADSIGKYNKTPRSGRQWCKSCGGHLFTEHPHWNLVDVYAAVIPDFPFKPGVHVNYQETKLPMKDGLPKLRDLPSEMGGSGVALAA